ncbi:MAG: hypothetical protein RR373_01815 [Akkermansia sp.]
MKKGGRKTLLPWKYPSQWIGLAVALGFSVYLIATMPSSGEMGMKSFKKLAENTEQIASVPTSTPDTQALQATQATSAKTSHHHQRHKGNKAGSTPSAPTTLWDKIMVKSSVIGKLLMMVAIAALIGSIAEARRWHLIFGYILGRFSRMMHLPAIVGIAMPTALYSNTAANSMLVSSHAEGKIGHSSLIVGGMANSYLSYLSHSLRVMYPVIGAIGIPGILYFGGQFTTGLLFILCLLLWHRRKLIKGNPTPEESTGESMHQDPLSWPSTFKKGAERVLTLLFRMLLISVPLMIFVEWLMKNGVFDFWEKYVPDWINRIFPPELMGIVAAQMGGLVQASVVAANLRDHGVVTNVQIILAMLVANAIGNPFRAMRRNLPSALGIFPAKEAFTIVVGMQLSRICGALLLILITVLFIHYTHP